MTDVFKKIGIVGAGTMGSGIAQVCARYGYMVIVYDVNPALLETARQRVEQQLAAQVEKGRLTEHERRETLTRILWTEDLRQLTVDLIIEAVVENLEIKQNIFRELESINDGKVLLTTNTSSIPVTQIAAALKNPANLAGLHFFNPAPVMKLVEIISGAATWAEWIEHLRTFAESLGKVAVVAKDSPGFIVNRVARPFYTEALLALEEQVADVKSIDDLLRSAGFKMGPFELMDLIGVDVNLSVTKSIYQGFQQQPRFRPSRVQQQLVDAGHLGIKSGRGFYDHVSDTN
jgi:3-hydroxybutyryl-CoA dehydrogenase